MLQFKEKKVAVLGLSVEGLDAVAFFVKEGARVFCCDQRSAQELGETYELLQKLPVTLNLGKTYVQHLSDYDVVVRTPGMALFLPELVKLRKEGKEITSVTKLFFDLCPAPIIGVTGTKGKGTTSTLIYEMLKEDGRHAFLGGNVGTPLLSKIDAIQKDDIVVLELSSFQLEDLTKSPHIAVVLGITQEHLANYDPLATNFHPTKQAYVEAKKSIIRFQSSSDWALLNANDPTSRSFARDTKAKILFFNTSEKNNAFVKNHAVYLLDQGKQNLICRASEIKLIGEHNLENIAAASLASWVAGVSLSSMQKVARAFRGLPHRLELVGEVDGVSYIDDSFSTTPETAIAALASFSSPIILILGGSEKGSDFHELGKAVARNRVKAVIVIGAMRDRIVDALEVGGYQRKVITGCQSMKEIVAKAGLEASSGDIVLLSPACASFGMFKNYKDRGDQFRYEVSHL